MRRKTHMTNVIAAVMGVVLLVLLVLGVWAWIVS